MGFEYSVFRMKNTFTAQEVVTIVRNYGRLAREHDDLEIDRDGVYYGDGGVALEVLADAGFFGE